jgi:8-oxo-dGTP pyrophosphatase MutT (NUDIX family)
MKERLVAASIVLNPEGRILIMKRASTKKVHPNLWGLPAGGAQDSEDLEETARREAFEETGLVIKALRKGLTLSVRVPRAVHKLTYFLGESEETQVTLNDEHSEYRWVTPEKALDYEFGIPQKHVKEVLEDFGLLK